MKLHLVGGFMGSGKTTAIIQAARQLLSQGLRVGVVTNDQGRYLVDTAFARFAQIPTVEVTGGCFCCNYPDLDASLDQLIDSTGPDVIFAESVGSCADLVATVINPLLKLKQASVTPATFSVFADARLLRRRLRGDPMPFSEDVVYVFDKQIEEAGLVVINKIDLLKTEALVETEALLRKAYPEKRILAQSSLRPEDVQEWMRHLENENNRLLPRIGLDIDYTRYGLGEAQLAWLDEVVTFKGSRSGEAFFHLVQAFLAGLRDQHASIGHLKFLVRTVVGETKLSFVTLEEEGWEQSLPEFPGEEISVVVNARVEMPAEALRGLFEHCLEMSGSTYEESGVSYFHPKQPNPTHRIA